MSGSPSWAAADAYLDARAAVDPAAAQARGDDVDLLLPDLTWDGFTARDAADRSARAALPPRPDDALGRALAERLDSEIALYDAGFTTTLLAPLATPVHRLREVFDDLPDHSEQDWARISTHLAAAAQGYADYGRTLLRSARAGGRAAVRQVGTVADQVASWIDPAGTDFYRALVARHDGDPTLHGELVARADQVSAAADGLVGLLRTELAPLATPTDAVGAELYRVTAGAFLGAEIDPAELYDYGWSELARLHAAAAALGHRLTGEREPAAARLALDARPGASVRPGPELVAWLQGRLDELGERLDGAFFDIPDATRRVEARMVTAGSGVMYYSPPDPGLTRPGRVWWSVPPGTERVPTWREVSTVHHEGLPGHHLQFAVTMGLRDLHPWQRYLCHVHGYAEGWAHYAEQLALDWGMVHEEAEILGIYQAQLWRAARIVIDIGLHLGFPVPAGNPLLTAERWDPEVATEFLARVAGIDPVTAHWEVVRYLGWPGQALAFKAGARLWTAARDARAAASGAAFDLKQFHMTALGLGPMGLGPLRETLAKENHA
ncbi:DUF885 domain-containing protein [Nocardioides sp. SLBN-35]|uniref:DUF885 domain-containing protein n=1 Tax=Nocardioides sp. SLBN-35 TaxID=2768445 RepID=UPI00114FA16A|nr:DUF885 domain-containing protein [Nocardioides sp. SLBN-35]TQK68941.1 uncharacterized protein (DUF885 family) [Nocardioides sp. SLBN-35]